MKLARTYFVRFLVFVTALQILNLSVCGGEATNIRRVENARIIGESNQIDCMLEFVVEIMLDQKNSFQENGAHNNSGNHSLLLKHLYPKFFPNDYALKIEKFDNFSVLPILFKETYNYLFLKEVIPQPPNFKYPCV